MIISYPFVNCFGIILPETEQVAAQPNSSAHAWRPRLRPQGKSTVFVSSAFCCRLCDRKSRRSGSETNRRADQPTEAPPHCPKSILLAAVVTSKPAPKPNANRPQTRHLSAAPATTKPNLRNPTQSDLETGSETRKASEERTRGKAVSAWPFMEIWRGSGSGEGRFSKDR